MKVRVLIAAAALALAGGAPPLHLDSLGSGEPSLVQVETMIQHVNVLTS
ncbi:hypothetical protein [Nonomuraea gerenzanensis]|uniref:Uncharacterized protein n=1 Tax=Nonomuraea gerenzanensis TaxID=93944 RepID=A0A1M4EHQ0_9ACTN|nr:hypothetical protein [Nonomuraea gerenzanensis]UBU10114.1 hypothetical protein LCN96_37965 [Nonomuraea gerenzanensis]SBO98487.1 hypothetical protein BN4615_P8003 [Nonomuraea gerenzanensis]